MFPCPLLTIVLLLVLPSIILFECCSKKKRPKQRLPPAKAAKKQATVKKRYSSEGSSERCERYKRDLLKAHNLPTFQVPSRVKSSKSVSSGSSSDRRHRKPDNQLQDPMTESSSDRCVTATADGDTSEEGRIDVEHLEGPSTRSTPRLVTRTRPKGPSRFYQKRSSKNRSPSLSPRYSPSVTNTTPSLTPPFNRKQPRLNRTEKIPISIISYTRKPKRLDGTLYGYLSKPFPHFKIEPKTETANSPDSSDDAPDEQSALEIDTAQHRDQHNST